MAGSDDQIIYTFNEVDTGEVRYVGVTNNLKTRMRDHLFKARAGLEQTHKANWIRLQLANGIEPVPMVIEVTSSLLRAEREIFWIAHYRTLGMRLTIGTGSIPLASCRRIQFALCVCSRPARALNK
jgi:predicted GIY-YIG superfamily endonuclease